MTNKFNVGDRVRFVFENYEKDINSDSALSYKACIGKIGTVVDIISHGVYPYDVDFGGSTLLFLEEELELV